MSTKNNHWISRPSEGGRAEVSSSRSYPEKEKLVCY